MKLIVQIPCLNEEQTIAETIRAIPRTLLGVDSVEVLVIDDGSRDRTAEIAREAGADHIVSHARNLGLAAGFRTGIDTALRLGADLIVNTDGDHQYRGADIATLVQPVLEKRADIVIGDRQFRAVRQFGPLKTRLQILGSQVVSSLAGHPVPDAVSGFRAFSRDAAIRLNIHSRFSYTTETIIQAFNRGMTVVSVPVTTNRVDRPSRLAGSSLRFIIQQAVIMIRMYAMYRPMRFFFYRGSVFLLAGMIPVLRFLWFNINGAGQGHIQSLVLGAALLGAGFLLLVTGLLSDLIAQNRRLTESVLERLKRLELEGVPDSTARPGRKEEKKKR